MFYKYLVTKSNAMIAKPLHLNLLVEILLKSYFFDSRCILIFTDTDLIEFKTNIPKVCVKVENETLNSNFIFQHYGCQDVIIHHDNGLELFIQFEKLIRLYNERFNLRRYIIIEKQTFQNYDIKELDYVCSVLIIVPQNENTYDKNGVTEEKYKLMTHYYAHYSKTKRNKWKIIDVWFSKNSTFLYGNDLFPDKLKNQNGRQLRIGTFTYEPYSVVGDDNKTFHGTEASLIFEFVKKYNMTPSFTIIGDDYWGDIYDNWTGIGLLGSLVEDAVDIGYAAIYTWDGYYNFVDYTKPLIRTGITCLVPAPTLAAGWLTPLYSFSLEMWGALTITFWFNTIVLVWFNTFEESSKKNENNHEDFSTTEFKTSSKCTKLPKNFIDSLFVMIRMYLLQSLPFKMNTRLLKYFVTLNLGYVLLLTSSYSSGLASVMTLPRYEKAIKTVKDLAFSGLHWGAPSDAWLISIKQVEDPDYKVIKNNFVVKNEEDLIKESNLHNFGFSLERLPYGHFAVGPYVKRDVMTNYRIMVEDIYWEQCIFVVRKNSVLLPLLDNLILRVFEAGLEAYWENRVVAQYMDMSVQKAIKYYTFSTQEHEVVKLKWTHVEGAFAILLFGYLFSIAVFLAEGIASKLKAQDKNQ